MITKEDIIKWNQLLELEDKKDEKKSELDNEYNKLGSFVSSLLRNLVSRKTVIKILKFDDGKRLAMGKNGLAWTHEWSDGKFDSLNYIYNLNAIKEALDENYDDIALYCSKESSRDILKKLGKLLKEFNIKRNEVERNKTVPRYICSVLKVNNDRRTKILQDICVKMLTYSGEGYNDGFGMPDAIENLSFEELDSFMVIEQIYDQFVAFMQDILSEYDKNIEYIKTFHKKAKGELGGYLVCDAL